MTAAAATLTDRIAAFAAEARFEDIPDDLIERVRLHLLDAIGCALAAAPTDLARRLLAATAAGFPAGPCPILGSDRTAGPGAAAFANAGLINVLDFDDGFEVAGKGLGHPGASIVAAALAAMAGGSVDGRDLLTALAVAFEVNGRVILSIQPSPERHRQVYGVCQHQAIGAAVAYGRLSGLSAADLANAIGFAASLAPLPSLRKYNWEKRPLVSFKDYVAPAAEAGVRAVQHARAGLIGPVDVFDGETGFWRMIGSDRFDGAVLAQDLGRVWWARNLSLKTYPACRWIHTALESFEIAFREGGLDAVAIERITVHTSAGLARDFLDAAPATMVDAQFSLPFCLGAIAAGHPKAHWYDPAVMADPTVAAVAEKVTAEVDPEIDRVMSGPERRPAGRVTIRAGGRTLEGPFLALPRGTPERAVDRAEVISKFTDNATAGGWTADCIERLAGSILSLGAPGVRFSV